MQGAMQKFEVSYIKGCIGHPLKMNAGLTKDERKRGIGKELTTSCQDVTRIQRKVAKVIQRAIFQRVLNCR